MPQSVTDRVRRDAGFALAELLVVVMIVSLLAALALALFGNQLSKAQDVEAKVSAATAARTMEVCANERGGRYDSPGEPCDRTALTALEPTLAKLGTRLDDPNLGSDTYEITVHSKRAPAQVTFTIERLSNGKMDRTCVVNGQDKGGCRNPGGPGPDW
jgi:prepilin-type N-terminal cleavage/methylation domain-containing protein